MQLGLTQQELADYLGVQRSSLAKAEKGSLILTTAPLMKLVALEKHVQQQPTEKQELKEKNIFNKSSDFCKKTEIKCKCELNLLRSKLEVMKKTFSQLQYQYTIHTLAASDCNDLKSLKFLQTVRIQRRLNNCDEKAQEALKLRICILAAERSATAKYLKKFRYPGYTKPTFL